MAQLKSRLIVVVRQILFHLTHPNFIWPQLGYFLRWGEIVFLPINIDIEPNNNCNFRCPHCQVTHWNKKITHLDEKSFNKILTQLPSLRVIKLQGMGEPLFKKAAMFMALDKRIYCLEWRCYSMLYDRRFRYGQDG